MINYFNNYNLYRCSAFKFVFGVIVNKDGVIVAGAPIAKKFKGKTLKDIQNYYGSSARIELVDMS